MTRTPPASIAWLARAAVAAALLLSTARAGAAPPAAPASAEAEQKLVAELEQRDPKGAEVFAKATEARDHGDLDQMAALLGQVHQHDPWFVPATRRLCFAESARAHHALAVQLCEEAYQKDPSAIDAAALAMALLAADGDQPGYDARALGLAKEAATKAPDDYYCELALCQCALRTSDMASIDRCSSVLRRVSPKEASSLFFASLDDTAHGHLGEARHEIEQAREAGLSPPMVMAAIQAIDHATPPLMRWGPRVARAVGAWAIGFVAVLALAGALGALARAVAGVRRVYAAALALSCAYYAASLALAALAPLAAAVALVRLGLIERELSMKVIGSGAVLVVCCVAAMVASLLGGKRPLPGVSVLLEDNPDLDDALLTAAKASRSSRVDGVYATKGADVTIVDLGAGSLATPWRRGPRCLLLGVGALEGATVGDLRRAFAREHARLRAADDAGAGFVPVVRRTLTAASARMVERVGAVNVANPLFWVVKGFAWGFALASHGVASLAAQEPLDPALPPDEGDASEAWALIEDREALEARLPI